MKRGAASSVLWGLCGIFGVLVTGCGGGGGGGGNQPGPPNQAPSITSPATANAPENSAGTIYTATATDPDGNALTFSLSGGADQAAFAISAAGALSFARVPDFEAPTDADRNNVYLVQISVSDGTTSAVLNLAVTVTNVGPDGFRVARVGTGFAQPLYLTAVPDGSGRVFVVEKDGLIRILNPAAGTVAGDSVPRPRRPDFDHRRTRPARARSGTRLCRDRNLLRLSHQPFGHDRGAALSNRGRQPGRGGSCYGRCHPFHPASRRLEP